jgi:hypothetical protein
MMLPKPDVNWGNLWADLLKGAGRGLLVHDGSRLSQAALAGLEVFDAAQERRRHDERERPSGGGYQDMLLKLWSTMSPEERAAFLRLSSEEQKAYAKEWAEGPSDHDPRAGHADLPKASPRPPTPAQRWPHPSRPMSPNPIDGWHLQSILPFGSDGALRTPTYRR